MYIIVYIYNLYPFAGKDIRIYLYILYILYIYICNAGSCHPEKARKVPAQATERP